MIPPFLDCDVHFAEHTADATDAATSAMNAIRTALLGAGWTEPGAMYTMLSPARADCIRFSITVSKVSATRVGYVVKDHLGRLINNETYTQQDVPLGSSCAVYCGARYCWHEVNSGTTSIWGAGVFNRDPDEIDKPTPVYWATQGPITYGGTSKNNWWELWIAAQGTGSNSTSSYAISWTGPATAPDHFSGQGSMMFQPAEWGQSGGGYWFWGRLPNALWCDNSQWTGNTFVVPLDDSHTGTFRVVRGGSLNNWALAVRIE